MDFDPVLLARLQFAFTIIFHIIFPSFTIGLSAYIATLGAIWLRSGEDRYQRLMRFWTKIFAVSFAMGVVSGIVLSYQFGTNWSRFSVRCRQCDRPFARLRGSGGVFPGGDFPRRIAVRVQQGAALAHVFSAMAVAAGTTISAFWILSANSWMQTPAGFALKDGVAYPVDWLAVIFNPSFPYRFTHMLNAAYLSTGFVVLAVGARLPYRRPPCDEARTMLRMAIGLDRGAGAAAALHRRSARPEHAQASAEQDRRDRGHWDGSKPGISRSSPGPMRRPNQPVPISIPHGSSLILTHQWNGLFPGLKTCRRRTGRR